MYVKETILQILSAYHTRSLSDNTKIHISFIICKFLTNFFAEISHKYFRNIICLYQIVILYLY